MRSHVYTSLIAALSAVGLLPAWAVAADARVGVHPAHGEMVLLRNVNARHAYRAAPPSVGLIVDPRPNREINGALGTGELSDADFAAIAAAAGWEIERGWNDPDDWFGLRLLRNP